MKTKDKLLLIGFILVAVGVVMFFKSVHVGSWGFYRFGSNVSTGGIVIVLLILDAVLYVATKSKVAKVILPILLAALVLLLILGTRLSFSRLSLLDLLLMLAPAAVGTGLLLRAVFIKEK